MKLNKIIVILSSDDTERRRMIQQRLVKMGLALTTGDAGKLIKPTVDDFELQECYYVAAQKFNFTASPFNTNQLYRLAASGVAVVVGAKKVPREYEFMCEIFYQ